MYGSAAAFVTYASERGYDISSLSDDTAREQVLRRATSYIDGLGFEYLNSGRRVVRWPGAPTSASQTNEWPRTGATDAYGNTLASDSVPTRVEHATYEAAFAIHSGVNVNRSVAADQVVKRRKVDVIEREFAVGDSDMKVTDTRPVIPAVADLLAPLLNNADTYGITMVVS